MHHLLIPPNTDLHHLLGCVGNQVYELRPKNWTQKQRFLVNSRASGLLGGPLVLELDRGQVAQR